MTAQQQTERATTRALGGQSLIPLFANKPAHSSVPLAPSAAVARSGGQERPEAGARALLLTVASTAATSRPKATALRRSMRRMTVVALTIGAIMTASAGAAAEARYTGGAATVAPPSTATIGAHVAEASRRFGIPATWIRAVMRIESANDRHAVSPKGAIGLMQIMPQTWNDLRIRYGLGANPYDPRDNILAGAAYLREMHDRFGSPGFLAAYNAGPERYAQYLATGQALPGETQTYVAMLAPAVDGSRPERASDRAGDARDWRSASLFSVVVEHPPDSASPASALQPKALSAGATIVDLLALVPPSSGLFVRRDDGKASR